MIMTAVVCTILIFCIWMLLTALTEANEIALTAFAVLFGFWCGAAINFTPVCVAQVSKVEEVGKRVGTTFLIASIGALVGVPSVAPSLIPTTAIIKDWSSSQVDYT